MSAATTSREDRLKRRRLSVDDIQRATIIDITKSVVTSPKKQLSKDMSENQMLKKITDSIVRYDHYMLSKFVHMLIPRTYDACILMDMNQIVSQLNGTVMSWGNEKLTKDLVKGFARRATDKTLLSFICQFLVTVAMHQHSYSSHIELMYEIILLERDVYHAPVKAVAAIGALLHARWAWSPEVTVNLIENAWLFEVVPLIQNIFHDKPEGCDEIDKFIDQLAPALEPLHEYKEEVEKWMGEQNASRSVLCRGDTPYPDIHCFPSMYQPSSRTDDCGY